MAVYDHRPMVDRWIVKFLLRRLASRRRRLSG